MSDTAGKDYDRIRERMQHFNAPPATPKDDMWPAIQASWLAQAGRRKVVRIRNQRMSWVVAAAALIVMGVVIGRWSSNQSVVLQDAVAVTDGPTDEAGVPLTYRLAASRHFSQAETLLLLFQTETGAEDVAPLARHLLTTTRLLLDSRAANDLRVRELLLDLELVLSQMVQLQPGTDPGERAFITEGLDGSTLLPRLRNLIPTAPARRAGV